MRIIHICLAIFMFSLFQFVYADSVGDVAYLNQNTTIWADYLNGSSYGTNVSQVNLTIYYPNSSIFVSNVSMNQLYTGAWYYSFVPTVKGNFYIVARYYNSSILVGTQSQSLSVLEVDMLQVLIIMFFMSLALLGVWLSYTFWYRANDSTGWNKWFSSVFMVGVVFCLFITSYFLMIFSVGQSYYSVISSVFYVFGILMQMVMYVGLFLLTFWVLWSGLSWAIRKISGKK